jgi:pilus assembly protein Flp/PilA
MEKLLRRLWLEQQGQDLVEYALLIALVAMAAIASFKTLANALKDVFSNAAANLTPS